MWPCDNQENNNPLIPHSLEKDTTLNNMFSAATPPTNLCVPHEHYIYNADYSKVVAQLVSLITNIETKVRHHLRNRHNQYLIRLITLIRKKQKC